MPPDNNYKLPITPRADDISNQLHPQTLTSVVRLANEFGIEIDDFSDARYLCWLIELLKHVKDTNHNFPRGKWATIKALEAVVGELARKTVHIFYGDV